MSELTRDVVFTSAWDKRSDNPTENYGVHGVEARFYLEGPEGVIQFVIYTNWMLPEVQDEQLHEHKPLTPSRIEALFTPMAADIGYHSPEPIHGYETEFDECDFLEDGCHYDGSGLRAKDYLETLIRGGTEELWPALEEEYKRVFHQKEESSDE